MTRYASDILNDYINYRPSLDIEEPAIATTDDIGDCAPFTSLVAAISSQGKTGMPGILQGNIRMPFDEFEPFDATKAVHDFIITSSYKDTENLNRLVQDYEDVISLPASFESMDAMIQIGIRNGSGSSLPAILNDLDVRVRDAARKLQAFDAGLAGKLNGQGSGESFAKIAEKAKGSEIESHAVTTGTMAAFGIDIRNVKSWSGATPAWVDESRGDVWTKYMKRLVGDGSHARKASEVREVVIHGSGGGGTYEFVLGGERGSNYARGISLFHFLIEKSGRIVMFIDPAEAWVYHSESGKYDRETIGIELENETSNAGDYTAAQYASLNYLISDYLVRRRKFRISRITTHSYNRYLFKGTYHEFGCPGNSFQWNLLTAGLAEQGITSIALPAATEDMGTTLTSYSLKGDNGLVSEITKALTTKLSIMRSTCNEIIPDLYRRHLTKMYRFISNDVGRSVEDIVINVNPGTGVYLSMAGEQAPIVQSMGGREVQAHVSMTLTDLASLAKLSLLFKVTDKHDQIVSMLMLASSAYSAVSGTSRIRHIMAYAQQEQFEQMIKSLQGKRVSRRLDEPVRIKNELLNSMGWYTFMPYSFEVKSIDDAAGAFSVVLVFKYINLGNRNLESLKKDKRDRSVPILPLGVRIGIDEENKDKAKLNFIGSMTNLAVSHGIADLLPIYVLSRIWNMYLRLEVISANNDGTKERDFTNVVDLMDILGNYGLWKSSDVADRIQQLSDNRNEMWDMFKDLIADGAGYALMGSRIIDTVIIGVALDNKVSSVSIGKSPLSKSVNKLRANVADAHGIAGTSGAAASGVAGVFKETFEGIRRNVPEALKKVLYSALPAGAAFVGASLTTGVTALATDSKEGQLDLNVSSLMPIMIFDMLRDFLTIMRDLPDGSVYSYVTGMADDTMALLNAAASGTTGEGHHCKTLKFSQPITITGSDKKKRGISSIRVFFRLGGINQKKNSENPFSVSTGINGIIDDLKEEAQAIEKSTDGSGIPMSTVSASMISLWSARAIEYINGISRLLRMPESDGAIFNELMLTAKRISTQGWAQKHAVEVISAIITSSMIDKTAYGIVMSSGETAGRGSYAKLLSHLHDGIGDNAYIAIETSLSSLNSSMIAAAGDINDLGISHEIVSGMFVSNSFQTPEIRKGVLNAMVIALDAATAEAINRKNANAPVVRILNAVDPGILSILGEFLVSWVMIIPEVLYSFKKEIILAACMFLVGAVVKAALVIVKTIIRTIYWVLTVFDATVSFMSILGPKIMSYSVRNINYFSLSYWMTGIIIDACDQNVLGRCALESRIWIRMILEYGIDAYDDYSTSYVDFPTVKLGGEHMSPDFYVAKIEGYHEGMAKLSEIIGNITDEIKEQNRYFDGSNFKSMLTKIRDRASGMKHSYLVKSAASLQALLDDLFYSTTPFFDRPSSITPLTAADKARIGATFQAIAYLIDKSISKNSPTYDRSCGFVYLMFKDVTGNKTYKRADGVAESKCVFTMTVQSDGDIIIKENTLFWELLSDTGMEEGIRKLTGAGSVLDDDTRLPITINLQIVSAMMSELYSLARSLKSYRKDVANPFNNAMPDTIENMMLARSLVGSNIQAVGEPGLALLKSTLERIGQDTTKRMARFRSNYIYPTYRLFFIEEDNDAWYLFDDLYSYASVISVAIHDDENSPMGSCSIDITNLFGRLDDVLSDTVNKENNFITGTDPSGSLNSIMLRVGAKIKIQFGYCPVLRERETVFSGKISSITPGELMHIEAVSGGDVLLEDISSDKIVVYGEEGRLTDGLIGMSVSEVLQGVESMTRIKSYRRPADTIKKMAGYVLSEVTRSRLDDYTINPDFQVDFDDELKESTMSVSQAIKDMLFSDYLTFMAKEGAGITVNTSFNRQLFENVKIDGDVNHNVTGSTFIGAGDGAWVSQGESAWDILQGMNLLLPNNILTTRPFDTRSTLVWGHKDDFYRYRRAVDYTSAIAVQCAESLWSVLSHNRPSLEYLGMFVARDKDESTNAGSRALFTLVIFHTQQIMTAFNAVKGKDFEIPVGLRVTPGDAVGYTLAMKWFCSDLGGKLGYDFMAIHQDVLSARDISIRQMPQSSFDTPTPMTLKTILTNTTQPGMTIEVIAKHLAFEQAVMMLLDTLYRTVLSYSTSHRKIADTHIKCSGKDLISNDMKLMEPYNTVKMTYPPSTGVFTSVAEAVQESDEQKELPVPIHYKLEPWVTRVYASHFPNANVFPGARISVVSMAALSILRNCMTDTYDGQLVFPLDPAIFPGDTIFLWDDTRDLYGIITVKERTHLFSHRDGAVTIVTPGMVTVNSYSMESGFGQWASFAWSMLKRSAFILAGAYIAYKGGKAAMHALSNKAKIKSISHASDDVASAGRWEKAGEKVDDLLGIFNKQKNILSQLQKLDKGKRVKEIVRNIVTNKLNIERKVVSDDAVAQVSNVLKNNGSSATIAGITDDVVKKAIASGCNMSFSKANRESNDFASVVVNNIEDELRLVCERNAVPEEETAKILAEVRKTLKSHYASPEINVSDDFVRMRKYIDELDVSDLKVGKHSSEEVKKALVEMADDMSFSQGSLRSLIGRVAKYGFGALAGMATVDTVIDIAEFIMINKVTADNITICPLMFRGEPYVAGVDGMTKQDVADLGMYDILKARFSGLGSAINHAFMDDWDSMIYDMIVDIKDTNEEYKTHGPTSAI
jgi:hypothetical protein